MPLVAPTLTQLEYEPADFARAEAMGRQLGYSQMAYTSTSALWGMFCLPENPEYAKRGQATRPGCIIKTRELGLLFVQDWEDVGVRCQTCDATISAAQAGLSMARADDAPARCKDCITAELTRARQAGCDHNAMVPTGDPAFAWRCADCGYVYGKGVRVGKELKPVRCPHGAEPGPCYLCDDPEGGRR